MRNTDASARKRQKMIVMSGYGLLAFENASRKTALYEHCCTGNIIRVFVDSGEYENVDRKNLNPILMGV